MRFALILLALMSTTTLSAQSIQAFRARGSSDQEIQAVLDSLRSIVASRLAALDVSAGIVENGELSGQEVTRANARVVRRAVDAQRELARQVLAAGSDVDLFLQRYAALRAYQEGVQDALSAESRTLAQVGILRAPPVLHKIPDVNFVIGSSSLVRDGISPLHELEISTNLLGATVGAAFDVMGSDAMKKYFQDNLTLGTGFPYGGEGRLTGTLGIGLGRLPVPRLTVWPAINFQQIDSSDTRVPADVRAAVPTAANWSSPSLNLAVSWWSLEEIRTRMNAGRFVPIVTVGIRFHQYYPGGPLDAAAALFSSKRSDYRRSGRIGLLLGIYFPLQAVQPLKAAP